MSTLDWDQLAKIRQHDWGKFSCPTWQTALKFRDFTEPYFRLCSNRNLNALSTTRTVYTWGACVCMESFKDSLANTRDSLKTCSIKTCTFCLYCSLTQQHYSSKTKVSFNFSDQLSFEKSNQNKYTQATRYTCVISVLRWIRGRRNEYMLRLKTPRPWKKEAKLSHGTQAKLICINVLIERIRTVKVTCIPLK